jgi:putative hydrolase of the HAD superfamily
MPILFCDLDNTLIDRAAGYRAWAEDYVARLGGGPADVDWLVEIDRDGFRRREPLFEEVRARWGLDAPVAELIERYRSEYPAFVPPTDPAVTGRLAGLRRSGWTIAVVTNGPRSQRVKVEHSGLMAVVDVLAISEEVGVSKPDRRIFEAAARKAGARIEEGWLVGDSPEADIAAAVEMGIPGIWLRRGRAWSEPRWRPHAVADSVEEALSLVPG